MLARRVVENAEHAVTIGGEPMQRIQHVVSSARPAILSKDGNSRHEIMQMRYERVNELLRLSHAWAQATAEALVDAKCYESAAAVKIVAETGADYLVMEGCDRGDSGSGDASGSTSGSNAEGVRASLPLPYLGLFHPLHFSFNAAFNRRKVEYFDAACYGPINLDSLSPNHLYCTTKMYGKYYI
jgi:hypothetical protein